MPQEQEPLKRITINIYEADYEWLQINLGEGYQVWVRDILRAEIKRVHYGK